MINFDEPDFINVVSFEMDDYNGKLIEEVKTLFNEEPFAILATEGEGQPYTSMISFAMSDDCKYLVFSSPRETRKIREIINNEKVSLLIDNRDRQPESINDICSLTITGTASVLSKEAESVKWENLLLKKHRYLDKFIKSHTSSLVLIKVELLWYVRRFQEVYQWNPLKSDFKK